MIELVVVIVIMAIAVTIALPQISSARRVLRFSGLAREMMSQLRYARQQAITQRQVIRFRYDNLLKQIDIIDNQETGTPGNPLANNPANDVVLRSLPIGVGGLSASEFVYGKPSSAPAILPDGTTITPVNGATNQVEIIFQPDGSVLDASGNVVNSALFFYNEYDQNKTAKAISVLGSVGRVKLWRYDSNANTFLE